MTEWSTSFVSAPAQVAALLSEQQAGAMRKTQDELIEEVQEIADRWCARRHMAVQAAFDLNLVSLSNNGLLGAADAWMRWCKGVLHRLSDDASDQMELAVAVAKCCNNGAYLANGRSEGGRTKPLTSKRAPAKQRRLSRARRKSR